jgi:hypothetical protein
VTKIAGRVRSGRGAASARMAEVQTELEGITNEAIIPGTLNIILDRPLRLNEAEARFFGKNLRMLWPATLNGIDVWVIRWKDTALHVAEVLSSVHLRDQFGLKDGDRVTLTMHIDHIDRIGAIGRTVWAIVWVGRRDWCYTSDGYYFKLRKYCMALGATQQSPTGALRSVSLALAREWIKRTLRKSRKQQPRTTDLSLSRQITMPNDPTGSAPSWSSCYPLSKGAKSDRRRPIR